MTQTTLPDGGHEFARGWRVVLAAALGVTCGVTAVPIYTLGAFIGPLQKAFGWSRGQVQAGTFFAYAAVVIASPLVGLLVDRYGARRIALVSVCGIALAIASVADLAALGLPGFYLGYALIGLLGAGTAPVVWTRAVNAWFLRRRGVALGLTLMGTGLFAALGPGFVTTVIQAAGWQMGYAALGAVPLVLVLPVALLWFRERPQAADAASVEASGVTLAAAARTAPFWIIALAFLAFSTGVSGFIPNFIPMLVDGGLTPATAAAVAGLIGLAVMAGRVLGGFLLDRFSAPRVAATIMILPALGCALASWATGSTLATLSAVLVGLSAGAEFDLVAFMSARYFGLRHYGKINAVLFAGVIAGGALGPMIFGFAFDRSGSYHVILAACAVAFLLTAAAQLLLERRPQPARRLAATSPIT